MMSTRITRAFDAWMDNPTPRTHAQLIAEMGRVNNMMRDRGIEDVWHDDINVRCPRELRTMMELYKRRGSHLAAA